jgi:transposase
MNIHKNAALTPKSRAEVARRIAEGQPKAMVAKAFGICVKTAVKWFRRFQSGGEAAMMDRSSRPRKLYRPTPQTVIEQVIELRNMRIPGKEVARRLGLSPATVSRILRAVKLSRMKGLSLPQPVNRYERQKPGEIILAQPWQSPKSSEVLCQLSKPLSNLSKVAIRPVSLSSLLGRGATSAQRPNLLFIWCSTKGPEDKMPR